MLPIPNCRRAPLSYKNPGSITWISENNNVGLAHTRLSIIDLDKRSKQPMKKKKYIITFNGEIYNYIEIKKKSKNFISYTS